MVATWLVIDLIRFSGPLLSALFDIGLAAAVTAAVGTYAGAGVVAAALTIVGRRSGLGATIFSLAVPLAALRVLVPFLSADVLIMYGLIFVGLGLALLLMAARSAAAAGGGGAVGAALATGALTAVLEQGVLRSWDGLWRDDVRGWVLGGVLALALLTTAFKARGAASERSVRGLWAVGLWLSLAAFAFANVAFVSSQSGYHLGVAVILAAVGLAGGAYLASRQPNVAAPAVAAMGVTTALALWTMVHFSGPIQLLMAPVASAGATYLMSRAIHAGAAMRTGWLFAIAAVPAGVLTLLPFMLVQLDYDVPLGIWPRIALVAAVAGIAVAATVRAARHDAERRIAPGIVGFRRRAGAGAIGSVALGAIALVTFAGGPAAEAHSAGGELRVVDWNLHYGVAPAEDGPRVDLDAIAAEILEQQPDVVVLQEVQRGWILGGGSDMLQYLADALDMNYYFAPAHDRQFGNAVLSVYPIVESSTVELPFGAGPQRRSAAVVTVDTGDAQVQVVSVHLQHRAGGADTRVEQVEALIDALPEADYSVVAGDFNSGVEDAPIGLLRDDGYLVADHIATGDAGDADVRIDTILLSGLDAADYTAWESRESDHPGLAVTVLLP